MTSSVERPVEIEDFTIDPGGRALRARWLRPVGAAADAPPLVLLHEGLGAIAMWKDFPAQLAARLNLLA